MIPLALMVCSGCVEKFVHNRVQQIADRNAHPNHSNSVVEPPAKVVNAEPLVTGKPQVRLIGCKTDVAMRYLFLTPNVPVPPFRHWRKWFLDHQDAMHCVLEWRREDGQWFYGEMRSTHFEKRLDIFQVGGGEFPGTAYNAYGIYLIPGRVPRDVDERGDKVEVVLDEEVPCDWNAVEREIRGYGAKYAQSGAPGTGGGGKHNVGLGGPAYKPGQNSNTMVNYILRRCGYKRAAPDKAVGWDREPHFPYSTNAETVKLDSTP